MSKLTEIDKIKLSKLIEDSPPTIGVIGVSGVGKSSTINTMFKTTLPTSHTKACTKEFCEIELELQMKQGPTEGKNVQLVVYDAPGLGESINKDPEYLSMYRENLPKCDAILWILSAKNRAIALDQYYLSKFPEYHNRIIFGLNQVDIVEPMTWKSSSPIPFNEQEKNIAEIVEDRSKRISKYLGKNIDVIPYSNKRGYNLEGLFTELIKSCTGNKSWMFSGLKNFSYTDFVTKDEKNNKTQINDENIFFNKAIKNGLNIFKNGFEYFTSSNYVINEDIKPHLKRIIGRDNITDNPLSRQEIDKIEYWVKQNRREKNVR